MTLNKSRCYSWLITIFTIATLFLSFVPEAYTYSVFEGRFEAQMKKANAGDTRAQYKMGVAYMRGTSNNFDKKKAIRWFNKAAAKGYAKAWFRLGQMHYDPKYGMRNYSIAFKWFAKAARKNHGVSQYYMALHYYHGRGVHKDIDYALIWANRAKKNGIGDASRLLKKLNSLARRVTPPVRQVVRSKPKPRVKRPKRVDVAVPSLSIRRVLTAGGWNQGNIPSDYVPSSSNKCVKVNTKIRCVSRRLKITRPAYVAHYRIVSLITNFKSRGVFTIKSRRKFLFILPEDPDDPNPNVDMPNTGMEDKIAVLNCKLLAKSHIRCYKADKTVIRFTKK